MSEAPWRVAAPGAESVCESRRSAVRRARQLVALHGSVAAARQALAAQLPAHDPYAEEDDDEVVGGEWAATMGVY